jgi:uncharacterized membrane protein YfcA
MELFIIAAVAFLASLATFYSGFGLGTLLMPAMALFFPVEVAVALTAFIHFVTNVFKLSLTFRHVQWSLALRFGLPAFLAAIAGAKVLEWIGEGGILYQWQVSGTPFFITWVKVVIAGMIIIFVLVEWLPMFKNFSFGKEKLVFGGLLSGFFGGLAGFQGALRSMFLIRFGLTKEGYIATGVVIACFIDVSRMAVYSLHSARQLMNENAALLSIGVVSASTGAFLGNMWLNKVTLATVQRLVAVCLLLFALGMGLGVL